MDGNGVTLQARLDEARRLYDTGLFKQAWEIARHLGDPLMWPRTEDQVLGGRLFSQTGAPQKGRQIVLRAWRRSPANHEAQHHVLWQVAGYRGSFAALQKLRSWWLDESADASARADQEAMAADFLGRLRDFTRAHAHLDAAFGLAPNMPWSHAIRAGVFEADDRHEDALAAARDALAIQPHYWAAAIRAAEALVNLGRDDEALELLTESAAHQESIAVTSDLVTLQIELGDQAGAARSLERARDVAPNLSGQPLLWWRARMSDVAYSTGDLEQAAHWAEQVDDSGFFTEFAKTLRSPEASSLRRVQLPLPFVRQHHLTCVPATLASICQFFDIPADHVEIADEICYDGTSNHSERAWAGRNGCRTREFRVTWESAKALIDRGVPFTLSTKHPGNGHLQAVTGYDELRRTLLIRDPSSRNKQEFAIKDLLEAQASSGPRGHALVPEAMAHLLEDIDLPDALLYDHHHRMQLALEKHQRAEAESELAALQEHAPGHLLTLMARSSIARYDQNQAHHLAAVEELLKAHSGDVNLQLARISLQRGLARREELMRDLRAVCESEGSHPLIWIELASELAQDARRHDEALRWLKKVARVMASAPAFHQGAHIAWARRRHDHAMELYRIAACLDDKVEAYADSYFTAARNLKRAEDGLAFLRERVQRMRRRSSLPSQTLLFSLEGMDRRMEARQVMAEALRDRPDDGGIKLVAMRQHLNDRNFAAAERLLEDARPFITQTAAWSAAARIAERMGDAARALEDWQRVLEALPLHMEARQAVARLLAQLEGRPAALAMLAGACHRFPCHYPLKQLHVEWLRDEPSEVEETELRQLLAIDPDDAWTRREMALTLNTLGRGEEALEQARLGVQLEPQASASHTVLGEVLMSLGHHDETRLAFLAAIRISVDNVQALRGLLAACDTLDQRRSAVNAIRAEVATQTTFGGAIESFADIARPYLAEDELLAFAREAHAARPDLLEAWSALILQLLACRQPEEAQRIAEEAAARFPHLPSVHTDLARVQQARLNADGRIAHLRQACEMNPSWGWAARELADALLDQERMPEALEVMERAVHHNALDAWNHYWLGIAKWRNSDRDGAIDAARAAVMLDPGIEPAWNALASWSREEGRPRLARDCAVELTRQRPGEARSWRVLAEMLTERDEAGARVDALRRAASLSPRAAGNWHALASALAELRRWDDALAACSPAVFGDHPPVSLRMRRASVLRKKGDPAASQQMQAALVEDPSAVWAWKELADWQVEDQQLDAARRSAGMIARLQPHDHIPLGFLAEIKLAQGDAAGAKADLTRALQLAPSYGFAAFTLFRLHIGDREWDLAADVLDRAAPHYPAQVLARRWHLMTEIDKNRDKEAAAALASLFASDDDTPAAFEYVLNVLRNRSRWLARAEKLALEAIKGAPASCNPSTGLFWTRLRIRRNAWRNNRVIRALPARSELAIRAFCEQMDGIPEVMNAIGRETSFLRLRLRLAIKDLVRSAPWFLQNDLCWGKAGYALLSLRDSRSVTKWLADWRERKSVEPWMLQNLIAALHMSGQMQEASAVIQHVLSLPYRDDTTSRIERLDALHRLHAGDPAALRPVAEAGEHEKLDAYDQGLHEFIRLIADYADSPPRRRRFDSEAKGVLKRCWPTLHSSRGLKTFFNAGIQVIRRTTGSSGPGWWTASFRARQVGGRMLRITGVALLFLVALALTATGGGTAFGIGLLVYLAVLMSRRPDS